MRHDRIWTARCFLRCFFQWAKYADQFGKVNLCGGAEGQGGPNCLAEPLMASFFVPATEDHTTAGPGDVVQLISNLVNQRVGNDPPCTWVRVGQRLAPLEFMHDGPNESLLGGSGRTNADINALFAALINDPRNPTFQQAFGVPDAPQESFPFLRNTTHSSSGPLPPGESALAERFLIAGYGKSEVLTEDMRSAGAGEPQWTNPLCHSPLIPENSLNARVLEVVIPLVVPSAEIMSRAELNSYCSHSTDIGDNPFPHSWAVEGESGPRVAAFAKVVLYDFSFDPLTDPVDGDESPRGGRRAS